MPTRRSLLTSAASMALGCNVAHAANPSGLKLSSLIPAFESITMVANPSDSSVIAVNCERDHQWWGKLQVFHCTGDQVDWAFAFPRDYDEWRGHYVVRCRWIKLAQLGSGVLEVIESTHMGNGSLSLWELKEKELRPLLHIKVRGRCFEALEGFNISATSEARFEGTHLNIDYRASEGTKAEDVVLSGRLLIEDGSGQLLPPKNYEQRCVWNPVGRVFEPRPPISPT